MRDGYDWRQLAATPKLRGLILRVRWLTRILTIFLVCSLVCVALDGVALPVEAADEAGAIEVDEERGEVKIACRFVNPTRVLEVFACHRQGPTHETVLEFDAIGPEIYAALRDIGCRSAGIWNVTGPNDFVKTQGDRLLAIARWKWKDRLLEYPAEGLLQDGDFGFPAFVRGFSFGARRPPPPRTAGTDGDGDTNKDTASIADSIDPPPRVAAIPEIVEVTLGGTARQSQIYSVLWHPTTSSALLPWMMPPSVNPKIVEDLDELVGKRTSAELILKRLKSERELIDYLRATAAERGVADRLDLYDRMQPLAEAIDRKKRKLQSIAAKLRRIVADSKGDVEREKEILPLHLRARVLVEEIELAFLTMYELQENFKLDWIQRQSEIPEEAKDYAATLFERGFAFEPRISRKRVGAARFLLDGAEPATNLPYQATLKDMIALEKEREALWAQAHLRNVRQKLRETEKEDSYTRELWKSDIDDLEILLRRLRLERALLESETTELRARHEKSWDRLKKNVLAEREILQSELKVVDLERQLAEINNELRWARQDLESQLKDRREKAVETMDKLTREKQKIELRIKKARKLVPKANDE